MAPHIHVTAQGTIIGTVGGPMYLADLVLLSYPPRVGSGIEVRGLSRRHLEGARLETSGNAFWRDEVIVSGSIDGGVLVAERTYVDGTMVGLE